MMKRCHYCEEELEPGQPFCPQCGQGLPDEEPTLAPNAPTCPQGPSPLGGWTVVQESPTLPARKHQRWPIKTWLPSWAPGRSPAQPQHPFSATLLAIIVVLLTVVTALGATAYVLMHPQPQPVMTVTGAHTIGGLPVGSAEQVFHVLGQKFSENVVISVLLDGKPVHTDRVVHSDGNGNFKIALPITEVWRHGLHTLTARDADGYVTKNSVRVEVIPQPVITVSSQYHEGALPAGSNTTTLHLSGQDFSYQSVVQVLLDGRPLPTSQTITSDQNGGLEGDVPITADWSLGIHTLTARDAARYSTHTVETVEIVEQGEANTPGPNGAHPDDASFSLTATLLNEGSFNHQPYTFELALMVTGHPDPAGGSVCAARDNSQPQTFTGNIYNPTSGAPSGITYQEFITFTCNGLYKHGQLSYVEQATSDRMNLSNGVTCDAQAPYMFRSLQGTFSDPTHISGSWNSAPILYSCTSGFTLLGPSAQQNTWSGL